MFSKIPAVFKHIKVEYIFVSDIISSHNYKIENLTKLKDDILQKGMLYPLEIQSNRYKICCIGNQRLTILKSLCIEKAPVIFWQIIPFEINKNLINQKNLINVGLKNARHISGKERVLKKRKKKK